MHHRWPVVDIIVTTSKMSATPPKYDLDLSTHSTSRPEPVTRTIREWTFTSTVTTSVHTSGPEFTSTRGALAGSLDHARLCAVVYYDALRHDKLQQIHLFVEVCVMTVHTWVVLLRCRSGRALGRLRVALSQAYVICRTQAMTARAVCIRPGWDPRVVHCARA
jgi:hypothetical protein